MYAKRSFKNRRRRYGLIRQNEDIRNMRCQNGNARFCQNRFKPLQKERWLLVLMKCDMMGATHRRT